MSKVENYPLGYSEHEARRLVQQGSVLEAFTEEVFLRAGLRNGMKVLDVGSGVGDVAILVANLVGSDGAVIGVERSSASVKMARRRTAEQGLTHVSFEESDLADFDTDETFDAIVGRFVLSYIPDRVAVLQSLMRRLRPGGIIAFLEIDMTQIDQSPSSDMFRQARQWLLDGFAAGGTELEMGTQLYRTFLRAGLGEPAMLASYPVVSGSAYPAYEDMIHALRSLLPTIEAKGISTRVAMGLDTLGARLREDAAANERVLFMSRIVGAWARLSSEKHPME